MRVKVNNELSDYKNLDMGSPQGAVLSPLLFTIMLHDIETQVKMINNSIMLYADDICLISDIGKCRQTNNSGNDPTSSEMLKDHQTAINNLVKYMENNGFNFSEKKTQFQVVSNFKPNRDFAKINVNNVLIKHSNVITYLGLKFHCLLSWRPHFLEVKRKAMRYTNLIKILSGQPWARGSKFLVDVTRSLIRSIVSYGQECFFAATKSELQILDTIEHIALRVALGVPPNTSSDNLYSEVGWLPLAEERRLRCAQYVVRTQRIYNNLVNPFLTDDRGIHSKKDLLALRTKKHKSLKGKTTTIWETTKPQLESADINLNDIEKKIVPTVLPQNGFNFLNVNKDSVLSDTDRANNILIHHTLSPGVKKSEDPQAGTKANVYIDHFFQDYFQIYTDGSVQSNLETGIGIVWRKPGLPFDKLPFRSNCQKGKCTTSVELEAISGALEKIEEQKFKKNVILTDSLSSLQAIQKKPNNNYWLHNEIRYDLNSLKEQGITVEFCHVPSHCEVPGNELADLEANRGTKLNKPLPQPYTTISRTEGYRLLKDAAKKDKAHFPTLSTNNFNGKGIFPKNVSQHTILIYRRLKLDRPWFKFQEKVTGLKTKCPHCNNDFDYNHLTSEACQVLVNEIGFIHISLTASDSNIRKLLDSTSYNNWRDALYMCDLFRKSSVGHLL